MRIRTKINLFFSFSFVIIISIVLLLTSLSARRYFEDNFYKSMPYIAQASCASLQTRLDVGWNLSRTFVSQGYLIDYIESLETDEEKKRATIEAMQELTEAKDFATSFFVSALTNNAYYSMGAGSLKNNTLSKNNEGDQWFFSFLSSAQEISYDVDYNKLLNEFKLFFNTRIKNKDGKTIGVAGLAANLDSIVKSIKDSIPSSSSFLALARSDNRVVISSDEELIDQDITPLLNKLEAVPSNPNIRMYHDERLGKVVVDELKMDNVD